MLLSSCCCFFLSSLKPIFIYWFFDTWTWKNKSQHVVILLFVSKPLLSGESLIRKYKYDEKWNVWTARLLFIFKMAFVAFHLVRKKLTQEALGIDGSVVFFLCFIVIRRHIRLHSALSGSSWYFTHSTWVGKLQNRKRKPAFSLIHKAHEIENKQIQYKEE